MSNEFNIFNNFDISQVSIFKYVAYIFIEGT